jgi:AcrR family transcriptional regulator
MKPKNKPGLQKYHHGSLKRAIMEAALEMAAQSGPESLSLREIARRIGVTTAAPYHHFKDRQSLLIELAIEGYGELLVALRQRRDGASGAEDQLRAAVAAYLHFGQQHRALYAIMFSGEFATHSRFQEMILIANQSLELVRRSIAATSNLDQSQSTEAAFCAWSLVHGIVTLDQNGVLGESVAEQERLAIQGVFAIAKGMSRVLPPDRDNRPRQGGNAHTSPKVLGRQSRERRPRSTI